MAETIALFGTSADPPTIGHRAILSGLAKRYDRVLVWAVDNPFKRDQTLLYHRQKMLKILLDSTAPPLINVTWTPEISDRRSLKSVHQVSAMWPDADLVLVVGSDILGSLDHWYAIDELIQSVRFLMIPRPDFPILEEQVVAFRTKGGRIEIADFHGPRVSSSDFRLYQQAGVVPEAVLKYLTIHQLYQAQRVHA